jgi:hypothetical protein
MESPKISIALIEKGLLRIKFVKFQAVLTVIFFYLKNEYLKNCLADFKNECS